MAAADELAPEIAAFERMKPDLLRQYGAAWAIVAGQTLEGAFATFDEAARDALVRLGDRPYLIRHTEQAAASVPFLIVEA